MTAEECVEKLNGQGYDAYVEEGMPTIRVSSSEIKKYGKYKKLMQDIGWERSWGREEKR